MPVDTAQLSAPIGANQYRLNFPFWHNPKGPDGQGWNRLAILTVEPIQRCMLKPRTREAALDMLRGMARYGNIAAYDPCANLKGDCTSCPLANRQTDEWQPTWHIREDSQNHVWLLGNIEKAFAGRGYGFKTWQELLAAINVPMLRRQKDENGFYWIAS